MGHNISTINRLHILQRKMPRIIKCTQRNAELFALFYFSNIKLPRRVKIEHCLFINKYSNKKNICMTIKIGMIFKKK